MLRAVRFLPDVPNRMELVMGFGGPIGLSVLGLNLALAFNEQQVGPLEVITLGWILVIAGVLALVLALVMNNQRSRTTHVEERRDL